MARWAVWCLTVAIAAAACPATAGADAPPFLVNVTPPPPQVFDPTLPQVNPLAQRLGLTPTIELPVVVAPAVSCAAVGTDAPPVQVLPPGASVQVSPPPLPVFDPAPPPIDPLAQRLGLKPTIELRGRIEADAVLAAQSAASKEEIGTLQNGYGFRRARIGAQGTIGDSTSWVAEIDFANGNLRLKDVFVGLNSLPGVQLVKVGYFREPFSLEGATSSRFITFMERSTLNELDPARNWGAAGYWWPENERMTYAIGAFRTGTDSGGFSGGNNGNWAVTTRITGLPVYEDGDGVFRLIHIGGAFSQRRPPDGEVKYNPSPQSNLLDVDDSPVSPFLPDVNIPSNSQQLYDLQAAAVYGPLSFQGEWIATTIQQKEAGMVFLHGFYVYGSYFLTGEHRGYIKQDGAFGQVHVLNPLIRQGHSGASGCGAIELAARFSLANFSSPNLPPPPPGSAASSPTGTLLYQGTFGVNWYLNDYTRLMFNYVLSVPAASGLPALPVHSFGFRTAIYW